MIVECAGAPGAGKTALAGALHDRLALDGRASGATGRGTAQAAVRFVARHPALVVAALRAVRAAGPPWRDGRLALQRLLRDGARHEAARALPEDTVVVLPEGLLQRAVGLCVRPGRPARRDAVARYARRVPPPGLTVLVHAPLATCVARVAGRGAPRRLQGAPPAVLAAFVRDAAEAVDVAADTLARRGCPVIAVDNDADLDAALAPICRALALPAGVTAAAGVAR